MQRAEEGIRCPTAPHLIPLGQGLSLTLDMSFSLNESFAGHPPVGWEFGMEPQKGSLISLPDLREASRLIDNTSHTGQAPQTGSGKLSGCVRTDLTTVSPRDGTDKAWPPQVPPLANLQGLNPKLGDLISYSGPRLLAGRKPTFSLPMCLIALKQNPPRLRSPEPLGSSPHHCSGRDLPPAPTWKPGGCIHLSLAFPPPSLILGCSSHRTSAHPTPHSFKCPLGGS